MAYETGVRAVEIVFENLKPTDILTRKAFENAIVACSAIGGSTNAPIHLNAIARHVGVKLAIEDWETVGYDVPLLVDMQPAGKYLGEEYFRAGGLPAVMNELLKAGRIHGDAKTINGKTMAQNVKGAKAQDADVIRPYGKPMKTKAGFKIFERQSVRFRRYEDERDIAGIPRPLSVQSERPRRFRRPRRRVRGTGGLSQSDR